jgi:phosphatidylglycerophosphate synthase
MTETLPERRPIASRQSRWAQAVTGVLARAQISPNTISIIGMLACVLAGAALAATSHTSGIVHRALWLAAAILVQLRLMANMFDGMVALATGQSSPVGELFNEVPDRVSDAATLIGLGYAAHSSPTLGYLATALAIFTAYVRAQGKAAGAKHEFCGPMAKQHRMFVVTLTACAMSFLPVDLSARLRLPVIALGIIIAGCIVTVIRRLLRIAAMLKANA